MGLSWVWLQILSSRFQFFSQHNFERFAEVCMCFVACWTHYIVFDKLRALFFTAVFAIYLERYALFMPELFERLHLNLCEMRNIVNFAVALGTIHLIIFWIDIWFHLFSAPFIGAWHHEWH